MPHFSQWPRYMRETLDQKKRIVKRQARQQIERVFSPDKCRHLTLTRLITTAHNRSRSDPIGRTRRREKYAVTQRALAELRKIPLHCWFSTPRHYSAFALVVTRLIRNSFSVSAFGALGMCPPGLTFRSIHQLPRHAQPITRIVQLSRSVSAWTPDPLDLAGQPPNGSSHQ